MRKLVVCKFRRRKTIQPILLRHSAEADTLGSHYARHILPCGSYASAGGKSSNAEFKDSLYSNHNRIDIIKEIYEFSISVGYLWNPYNIYNSNNFYKENCCYR
jgi:hypothetical protein